MKVGDFLREISFGILPSHTDLSPSEQALEAFWNRARTRAKLYPLESLLGADDMSAFRPPTFSGDNPQEFCEGVLAGEISEIRTARADFPAEAPEPRVGELSILLDGDDIPQALLRTRQVDVTDEEIVEHVEIIYRAGQ
ncbi:MAG: hypothetical protein IKS49_06550 [Actinomycetaceae bacterium]|nr:hypothetical protein [Actinomycetaceae bacterium]